MTRLDPFFSYYGAGFRKCRRGFYPPPPEGDLIVERFAGSAAYACTFGADHDGKGRSREVRAMLGDWP